jgi:deferrochelatase/peroxidase EfeB
MPDTFLSNDLGASELSSAALANLQSNILRSTGRPRSTQVFHRFRGPQELATWLLREDTPTPTPASDEQPADPVVNLLFSSEALRWLLPSMELRRLEAMDQAFLHGIRHNESLSKLKTEREAWGVHSDKWHVVVLYAHDATPDFQAPESEDCAVEYGSGYQDGRQVTRRGQVSSGHFNLRDGISVPVYTEGDYAKLPNKPQGDMWAYDPRHKLSTLLVGDPLVDSSQAYGSYFAFLKYTQDKREFDARIAAMAKEIAKRSAGAQVNGVLAVEDVYGGLKGLTGADLVEGLKRHIIGRDTHGQTEFGTAGNNFDFKSDPEGTKCPYSAHISKMNPRGRTGDVEHERSKTIARRGTSYYQTKARGKVEEGTGLLFWSAQASIRNQFEYIMEKWAHHSNVDTDHLPTPDFDAVIGKPDQSSESFKSWWRWKNTTDMNFSIWACVALVGGEYLYAPSLAGVTALRKFAMAVKSGTKT